MSLSKQVFNRLKLTVLAALIVSFTMVVCIAGEQSNSKIYKMEYRLRYRDQKTSIDIRRAVKDAFNSPMSDIISKVTGKEKSDNTYLLKLTD